MKLPFLAYRPVYPDPPDPPEVVMATKTLSVSVAMTENPAGAPVPQQIFAALSSALSDSSFATVAPWTAVITVTSS